MATTTLTSLVPTKSEAKELCIICEVQPYDLICTCGDKFDFSCIHQHVEQIGLEFQNQYQETSEKLLQFTSLQEKENNNFDTNRTLIENWKRKRIEDINDIAEKANNDIQQRENLFHNVPLFQQTFEQLSTELHRIVHENLNNVIKLNQQIHEQIEACQNLSEIVSDDDSLDAALQRKLNPSHASFLSSSYTNNQESTTIEIDPIESSTFPPRIGSQRERSDTTPTMELTNTPKINGETNHLTNGETNHLTNGETNHLTNEDTNHVTNESTNYDEFEAGQTRYIQRRNPVIISTSNDQFAATICCHNNQLIYNVLDGTTQNHHLIFLPDINDPATKQTIEWNQRETTINAEDDEWIQDIIYSDKLSSYLLLNRTRLRVLNNDTNTLDEFHTFNDRTMKRLSCNEKFIYLTSTKSSAPYSGDEIILMNYDKEEQVRKTFREIVPSRINRGAGQLVGEISDLAVGANEQVTIGYRLERREEVGVFVFNVTNDGKEWSSVKQLLLNDCWHNALSYTPRIDWCDKLNVFILIEYITGHLIMIDRDGQVEGECCFMDARNRRESPINLSISTDDKLCVRYQSSISIHKLTS